MTQFVTPRNEGDWQGYAAVAAQSFARPVAETKAWVNSPPAKNAIVKVAIEGKRVIGGALAFPVGQMFGGRSVPAGAVADVSVLPEERGRGLGAALLRSLDGPMRDAGVAVSPLWPSTLWLYRRLGWEVAGRAERYVVSARSLARLGGPDRVVPDPGPAAVRELHGRAAAEWNGPLERPDWWWDWRQPAGEEGFFRYGWEESGELTGYVAYRQDPGGDHGHGLTVADFWTTSPGAVNGLLGFLGSHGAQVKDIAFDPSVLPLVHDLLWLAAGAEVHSEDYGPWMLRLVDFPAAMRARGWSAASDQRVELEVADPGAERPERYVLEVAGGQAELTRGGGGNVKATAGAMAAFYAGGLSAHRAARLGLMTGSDEDLDALDALIVSRPNWLPDVF